jgi:hypothetical protein
MARLLVLFLILSLGSIGCMDIDDDDDDDEACCDDDDDVCCDDDDTWEEDWAEIESTYPPEGATDFFYQYSLVVLFDDPVAELDGVLVDEGGQAIPCDVSLADDGKQAILDPFAGSVSEHLSPATGYIATLTWDGAEPFDLHFSTSEAGAPVADPATDVVGNDYLRDIRTARVASPEHFFAFIDNFDTDVFGAFHVSSDDGAALSGFGATVRDVGGSFEQDLCVPTVDLTAAWTDPVIHVGPMDLEFPAFSGVVADGQVTDVPFFDFDASGAFLPDGSALAGGTVAGTFDTRAYRAFVDPAGDEDVVCDMMDALGIGCDECPGGSGPFCVTFSLYDLAGPRIDVVSTHPETGLELAGLTAVSREEVEAWQGLGFCADSLR